MGVIVRQKTKGKGKPWWVFISYNGRRTSRMVGDKDAAETVASQIRAKLQLGEFGFEEKKEDPAFKEYADSWIEKIAPAECKGSTLKGYRDLLKNHILPVFGHLKLTEITRGKVKEFLAEKSNSGYAKSTVTHMKNVISNVFNKALDDEVIATNPALNLGKKMMKAKNPKEDINPLTQEELRLLLDTVKNDKNFRKDYPLFLLLARTGMRVGEALALQPGDIDVSARFIHIQRGLSRQEIQTPKNGKTRRVDMSLQLAEALKAHMDKNREKGFALGLGGPPEYLFTNEKGGLIDLVNWRARVFNKALKQAGLRKIRIHDLRHTYATLRIAKGDSILDVSNQLGHYSVKLTLDTYSHWLPGKKKDEVDELDDPEYRQYSKVTTLARTIELR